MQLRIIYSALIVSALTHLYKACFVAIVMSINRFYITEYSNQFLAFEIMSLTICYGDPFA